MFTIWKKLKKDKRGDALLFVIIFGFLAVTLIISSISSYSLLENRAANKKYNSNLSFHIAEAGVNYYRWHLAHNQNDYSDGGVEQENYIHEYYDKNGSLLGYFSLQIDEPLAGSSVVTIRSTGWVVGDEKNDRTIQVRLGFPSLTDYTFLSNAEMSFGFTTEVSGPVHSNGEIRFDGTSDSWVDSHVRVTGGGGPKSFWRYPVAFIDFDTITSDLSGLQDLGNESDGKYLASSGAEGWHIVFLGDNYELYRVLTRNCYEGEGRWRHKPWQGWYWDGDNYCYDVASEEFVENFSLPANGVIFSEDNVWVDGVVDGRVTVAVGRFPVQSPYKNIIISDNLVYNEKGSDDVIGLLAQGNIFVSHDTPDYMEINSALLSQYEGISRPYYYDDIKNSLTILGSQISYEGGGWKYVSGWGNVISGYENTYHSYDGNLKYYPPPGFPVETNYELISWEET